MFDRLSGLKNILWAVGIVLCLVLLFVGFVFSAVTPYHGEADPRTPNLNAIKEEKGTVDVDSLTFVEPDGELHELRETTDAGEDYIRSAVFLTDSIMIAMRDQTLTGGDVWSSESGSLPMGNIATWNILYSDGSKISPVDACMVTKPPVLFLCIGSDGLARVEKADFISGYESLIRAILVASPETTVVCCSIPPVTENYSAVDDLTSDLTNEGSEWIREACREIGVYFVDVAQAVRSGVDLNPKFAAANGKSLNAAGIQAVLGYLRTHAIDNCSAYSRTPV